MPEMSGDIKIREAQQADYEKIAQMHYPVWLESYNATMAPSMTDIFVTCWAEKEYPRKVSEGATIMLAESGGEPVGMTIFGPDPKNPNNLHIGALYIKREKQRGGMGSALLEKALASQLLGDVTLLCGEKNYKGRAFYADKGFERDNSKDFSWEPIPGIEVLELGYTLHR
jgi:GNAT superfamily N-acetyltransferase